jgi:predicted nucleotidyltransferase
MLRQQYDIISIGMIKKTVSIVFRKHLEIKLSYLYGSYSRNLKTKYSDIDIGVILDDKYEQGHRYIFTLAVELEESVKERLHKSVVFDVRVLNDATPRFLNQSIRKGLNIYSVNRNFKDEYELYVLHTYMDIKPFLDEMDKKYISGAVDGKD